MTLKELILHMHDISPVIFDIVAYSGYYFVVSMLQ